MNAADIQNRLDTDDRVFLHYTNEAGFNAIKQEGVVRQNNKFAVYLTREVLSPTQVSNVLFIGAGTHEGRGSHVFVVRLGPWIQLEKIGWGAPEYVARERIKLGQHEVIYQGRNPF